MTIEVIVAEAPLFTVAIDHFNVQTTVTSSGDEVERWIDETLEINSRHIYHLVVGLDVEWRPPYSRIRNPVAVLQICVGNRCLVFQILHSDYIPIDLITFLSDDCFTFVGVGIQNDADLLDEDCGLYMDQDHTVDLRTLAADTMGREDLRNAGLKKLAEEVLGMVIQKPRRVTMSNWDNETLSHAQIAYACADAFISFEIGKLLITGRF